MLLLVPLIRLDLAKNDFIFQASCVWNGLIQKLMNRSSTNSLGINTPGSSSNSDLSTSIKPSFMLNGTIVEDRREIANSFNNYFTSIALKLNECDDGLTIEPIPKFTDYIKSSSNTSIYLKECTSDEILNIIKELSSSKSSNIPITVPIETLWKHLITCALQVLY